MPWRRQGPSGQTSGDRAVFIGPYDLIDALSLRAKAAACEHRVPHEVMQFVEDAAAALEYAVARLGAVTHAANNF